MPHFRIASRLDDVLRSPGQFTAAAWATEQQLNVRLLEFSKQRDEMRAQDGRRGSRLELTHP
jgi:hypothetical protein